MAATTALLQPPVNLDQLRVSNREEDVMNTEQSMSGRQIVGLIIPPPDIRGLARL
jgi:hypothetical protein